MYIIMKSNQRKSSTSARIVFNIDEKLKAAVMKKAKAQGVTLTYVLTLAIELFAKGDLIIAMIHKDRKEK